MDVYRVTSVLVQFLVPMVLVCGNILAGVGLLSHYILYDIGDGSRVNFCKTGGVGRHLWLLVILNYSEFSKTRRQVWLSL